MEPAINNNFFVLFILIFYSDYFVSPLNKNLII